jgi:uncharacterized membrane protein
MKWLKRLVLSFAAVLVLSSPAAAAEQVSNFDSVVTVQKSGRVDVVENITYDFGYAQRHGIYRYIPVVYDDANEQTFKPGFAFDSVELNGQPVPYEVSNSGNNKMAKIGDPNKTITGPQVYTVRYHFDSLLVNKDGDLLRFNVAGAGWEVPIKQARVTIKGPVAPKLVCYAGVTGSRDSNCTTDEAAGTVATTGIGDGADLTVEALFPAGTVDTLLEPYKEPWWVGALIVASVLYVLVGIGLLIAAFVRWLGIRMAEKRAEQDQTIIAQYEPPKELTPGEIGFLSDNQATLVEVTAMLIQTAVLGYIKIEQIAEKSLLKKAQYKLIKLKEFTSLGADEQYLLTVLFDSKQEIELSDINKTTVPPAIQKYQESLRESAKQKGFYTQKSKFMTTAAIGGLFVLMIFIFTPFIFLIGLAMLPLGLYTYKRAGQSPRRTPQGLATWAHVAGFKLFLSVTEKDRLAFTDAPARTPKQFSKFLPYAIALGVENEWAKQFESIDVTKSLGWYGGNAQSFTAGYLAGNLSGSFASTVATSVAPQTSSGGFGGGSSGGGFSGGGGGSW